MKTPLRAADKKQIISCMLKNLDEELNDVREGISVGKEIRKIYVDPMYKWFVKQPKEFMGALSVEVKQYNGNPDDADRFVNGDVTFSDGKRIVCRTSYTVDLKDGPVVSYDYDDIPTLDLDAKKHKALYNIVKEGAKKQKDLQIRKQKVEKEMTALLERYSNYESLLTDFPDLVIYCGDVKKNAKTPHDRIQLIKKLVDGK